MSRRAPRRPTQAATAVTTCGSTTTVRPASPLLGGLRVGRLEVGPGGGRSLAKLDLSLFRLRPGDGGGDAVLWAGLTSVLVGLHKDGGVRVRVVARGRTLPAPAGGTPSQRDPQVVALPTLSQRALVRYGDGVDPLSLVAQLVAAHRHVHVVVLVRSRREGAALRGYLRATGVPDEAVSVCTLGTSGAAGLERAGLVLVVNALLSTWEDPLTAAPAPPVWPSRRPPAVGLMDRLLDLPPRAAVVGLLPRGRATSAFESARLWQLYGPGELVVPAHGVVVRPVEVAAHRIDLGRRLSAAADDLSVKKALWCDPLRNRRVAALARAFAAGDAAALAARFPGVAVGPAASAPRSVLVLCEGLDQANAVAERLRGARVVTGTDDDAGGPAAAGTVVVATALGVLKLVGCDFDAVVRADPGRGLPPLPPGWLDGPTPRPLLVVDVDDDGHPLAAVWSRQRRRAAAAAGWRVAGADADVADSRRFRLLTSNRRAHS